MKLIMTIHYNSPPVQMVSNICVLLAEVLKSFDITQTTEMHCVHSKKRNQSKILFDSVRLQIVYISTKNEDVSTPLTEGLYKLFNSAGCKAHVCYRFYKDSSTNENKYTKQVAYVIGENNC